MYEPWMREETAAITNACGGEGSHEENGLPQPLYPTGISDPRPGEGDWGRGRGARPFGSDPEPEDFLKCCCYSRMKLGRVTTMRPLGKLILTPHASVAAQSTGPYQGHLASGSKEAGSR